MQVSSSSTSKEVSLCGLKEGAPGLIGAWFEDAGLLPSYGCMQSSNS